jgi:hypothetical protein
MVYSVTGKNALYHPRTPWRHSLNGKTLDSYFINVGSTPIVSKGIGVQTVHHRWSLFIKAFRMFCQQCYSQYVFILNPIIVDDFCDSNIDEYYYYLFWGLWVCSAIVIPSKVFWDYCGDYQNFLFTNHSTYTPTSPCWFKLNLNDSRPLNSWTESSQFEYGIHWTKVLGQMSNKNELCLLDLPSSLACDGVLISLVSDLSSSDYKLIAAAVIRLIMLYYSHYKTLETHDDLIFFLQYASINFSPEAKKYLSYFSQKILRLHFNDKYTEKGYEILAENVHNPHVELAQGWIFLYDVLYY